MREFVKHLSPPLSALRPALCALRPTLCARRPPLCALRSALAALRSALCTLPPCRSALGHSAALHRSCALHSPRSALRSALAALRSASLASPFTLLQPTRTVLACLSYASRATAVHTDTYNLLSADGFSGLKEQITLAVNKSTPNAKEMVSLLSEMRGKMTKHLNPTLKGLVMEIFYHDVEDSDVVNKAERQPWILALWSFTLSLVFLF